MGVRFIITLILTIGAIVYYIQLLDRIVSKLNLSVFDIATLIIIFCLAILSLIETLIDIYEDEG